MHRFARIVSGGQTGVDRAALDVALELGLPCGGWCPKGRKAADGPIPDRYPLTEMSSASYPQRTRKNVRNSDGTLVLYLGRPGRERRATGSLAPESAVKGGTALTVKLAHGLGKPCLLVDLAAADVATVRRWAEAHHVSVLNVAGPRENEARGVYERARQFLRTLLLPAERSAKGRR